MNNEEFEVIFEDTVAKAREVLVTKAKEYAKGGDRLHNFKKAGDLKGETPRQALMGMMAKHTVSIYDMAMTTDTFTDAQWHEKIGDELNYLILLLAVIEDEKKLTQPKVVPQETPLYSPMQLGPSVVGE